jgi:chromosome segregation ATPase
MARKLVLLLIASSAPSSLAGALEGQQQEVMGMSANPIRRVVTLLQGMAKKVAAEGAKEKELYDKFMCYCSNSGGDLQASISASTAKVPQVQSDIEEAEAQLKQTKIDLKSHQEDRAAAKAAMATATSARESEHEKYVAESDEYKGYIGSLATAIPAIMKGMSGAFLQAEVGVALQKALAKSEQATDYDKQYVMAFLSGHSSNGYVPKSGEIVGILKEMKADFDKSLATVEDEEAGQVKIYDELMAAKTKQVEALTASIEKKSTKVGDLGVSIVTMKNDLTETEAALVEDQKFMANLDKSCKTKTSEFDERVKTRADEMVAIQETIKILNDDDALELFKKTLPSASLLQVTTSSAQLRQKALKLIRSMSHNDSPLGPRPALDLLALTLSSSTKKVDFSKVIKMIDNMVSLLKTEQVDDDSKKEYCEMQIAEVEDKGKALASKIEDRTASIEEKAEFIKTVASEIKDLTKNIKKLDKAVSDATYQRKSEHDEYVELISSNNAAKELLAFAKNRLNKFYNPKLYKPPAKRELTEEEKISTAMGGTMAPTAAPGGIAGTGVTAFVQIQEHHQHEDAPEPAPETWGAYSKKSEENSGVIAMIDLLIRDLDKEITEAEAEESDAQKDYEEMMDDSAKKRAADTKAIAAKETAKADAEATKVADEAAKDSEEKELKATKMYEMQLHSECDWLIQNFDLRKESRAEEMENLKNAKAILSGADFSLLQQEATPVRQLRGAAL